MREPQKLLLRLLPLVSVRRTQAAPRAVVVLHLLLRHLEERPEVHLKDLLAQVLAHHENHRLHARDSRFLRHSPMLEPR